MSDYCLLQQKQLFSLGQEQTCGLISHGHVGRAAGSSALHLQVGMASTGEVAAAIASKQEPDSKLLMAYSVMEKSWPMADGAEIGSTFLFIAPDN